MKHLKFITIIVFLAALCLCCSVAAQASQKASGERTLLVLGDSLSAAYNMAQEEAWPSLLQSRLDRKGYGKNGSGWRVFNSSIVGDTTQGGLSRLPRLLERYSPSIVFIELGGNDGLRGLPLEVTRKNLATMIELAQRSGASVILAGIRIPPNYGELYVDRFEAGFSELAESYGTALVPFFMEGVALDSQLMQADGIHPAVEAQPVLLDNLWPVLEPLLTTAGAEGGKSG